MQYSAQKIRLVLIVAVVAAALYIGSGVASFGESIKAKSDARTDAVSRYLK